MNLKLNGVDAVEFAVKSLTPIQKQVSQWGFRKLGEGVRNGIKQELWAQGKIKLLLSQSGGGNDPISRYLAKHGDGICNIYFQVDDASRALNIVADRGA